MKLNLKPKKKYLIIGGIFLIILAFILILLTVTSTSKDGAKFKREYESYNGKTSKSGSKYQVLKISKKNKVKYSSVEEALEVLKNGTGIIYFGFPNCPWCRGMLPVLLDKVECSCVDELLYVDMTGVRDEYEVKDDAPVNTKKASEEYYTLLNRLDGYLEEYTITDGDGIEYDVGEKRVYVPLVIAVKDGEIVGVYDGIELGEGQSPYDELTESQQSELEVIFENMIDEMTKANNLNVCDEHC